jgi:hypothetical protein
MTFVADGGRALSRFGGTGTLRLLGGTRPGDAHVVILVVRLRRLASGAEAGHSREGALTQPPARQLPHF